MDFWGPLIGLYFEFYMVSLYEMASLPCAGTRGRTPRGAGDYQISAPARASARPRARARARKRAGTRGHPKGAPELLSEFQGCESPPFAEFKVV